MRLLKYLCSSVSICGFIPVTAATSVPEDIQDFLGNYCLDCHDTETQKGEILLEYEGIDWKLKDNLFLWERVLNAVESGEMPPKKKRQPKDSERKALVKWVDGELLANTQIGGTLARRLNQAEYLATIQSLFNLRNFKLQAGFPADSKHHGFDNIGEGLLLSPPLLEAYAETAKRVADEIFPPTKKAPEPAVYKAGPRDLVISYSSSKVIDGAMRLGMKCDPIMRSCTWPSRIEAKHAGVYQFKVALSSFEPEDGQSMTAKIMARDVSSQDGVSHKSLRVLKEFVITKESPEIFEFEAELYAGQTVVFHWANATLDSDRSDKDDLKAFFQMKGEKDPRYLSAWNEMLSKESGQGFRGGVGWERVKAQLARDDLPELDAKQTEAVLKKVSSNPVLYAETVVFDVFENGPALEIHGLEVSGPHKLVDGPQKKENEKLKHAFLGKDQPPVEIIRRFLSKAFRRPVPDDTINLFLEIHDRHMEEGHSQDEAMHLVIRNALIAPQFLYRSLKDGSLDRYDLATRLAYFLTGDPPSTTLLAYATHGNLTDPNILRKEAKKLLPKSAKAPMIENFTGQWLDTRLLSDIMPDPKFKFQAQDEVNARLEVQYFFYEMLKGNRPMSDFIDPDFTWTSGNIAKNIYGLTSGYDKKKANGLHRVELQRGGRVGGLLGQSAVMMATANGVDTQPVVRGVWVLENILGMPPPPPPKSVPALTPDTQGATTPRDLLAAHTSSASCAGCHRKIDPVGFVLENFDPVGKWRDKWPGINVDINASSTLHDGTKIKDVVDFKAWLVENIDLFSQCLAEKLMTYATGRILNYSERKEIEGIVALNSIDGYGFRDLLLSLIESQTFRTK